MNCPMTILSIVPLTEIPFHWPMLLKCSVPLLSVLLTIALELPESYHPAGIWTKTNHILV